MHQKTIYTSNPMERFNASVKRELWKRISLNGERQAGIRLASINDSYKTGWLLERREDTGN